MIDRTCEVCNEYLATNIVKVYNEDGEQIHYLCDEHYEELENPRRLLSLLDFAGSLSEEVHKEIYPD